MTPDMVFLKDGKVTTIKNEVDRIVIEDRGGDRNFTLHTQDKGTHCRVVLRYGYKDFEEFMFTQRDHLRALKRLHPGR